jgi:uncharacterized protein YabE (DUF348 family)
MVVVRKKTNKKIILLIAVLALGIFFAVSHYSANSRAYSISDAKEVTLIDGGSTFQVDTSAGNVGDFLAEQKIIIGDHDAIYPDSGSKIFSGSKIIIQRAKKITVVESGNSTDEYTFQNTVEKALWENKVDLGDDDITVPARNSAVMDGMKIKVTHVQIKEETKDEPIAFQTVTNQDSSLGWRVKKISQAGVAGVMEVNYKVVYYDGKEISRKVLGQNKVSDPVNQIVTQGTLVKVGKTYNGAGSWYSYTGKLAAANPWLPMGSYARVTNTANGKSVIVVINDRGPFGNGRIIDLDKVAFEQIADLGAGVANVKVEAITN